MQFAIPETYRPAADDSLRAFLRDHSASAVRISVAAVRRFDTMLVQLLLCAARDWKRRGLEFDLCGVSEVFDARLQILGVTRGILQRRAGA